MAQYADIIEIVAPGQASAGSRVDVTVRVRNLYSSVISILVVAFPDYAGVPGGLYITGLYPQETWANVPAGATQSFSGYFTMPDKNVTIRAYSYWYGSDGSWYFDDEMTKVVNLAEVVASQFGSIEIVSYERRL
ncbi:hypothetical protein B1778_00800 [Dehalococcoides mccartyi]|uniref:hypothetical protein n=1 Tax=Dehalococcoides mccartyi TaxID=61435 RepID=UPI00098F8B7D|nr:hypothetical protein [Dehalococcoides mccartyi]AQU05311.1 hypothetical protein B1777_00945 [Dehalococcoides mccartyi]AQU06764.1 hypothetical protein B1778_00800 [Dehalococcoides mccartyi]